MAWDTTIGAYLITPEMSEFLQQEHRDLSVLRSLVARQSCRVSSVALSVHLQHAVEQVKQTILDSLAVSIILPRGQNCSEKGCLVFAQTATLSTCFPKLLAGVSREVTTRIFAPQRRHEIIF